MGRRAALLLSLILTMSFALSCNGEGIVNPTGPPVAKAGALFKASAWVGETVIFSDRGSYDPDGGEIKRYEWDWDNDGVFDEEGKIVSHSWLSSGIYQVGFRAIDDEDLAGVIDQPLIVEIKAVQVHFKIDARVQWVDTGVIIQDGMELSFEATGEAYFSVPGEPTGPRGHWTGIDGPAFPDTALAKGPLAQLADDGRYYFYALVARIGAGTPTYVGSQRTIVTETGGRLFLTANDQEWNYGDNSGSWQVSLVIGE